MSERDEVVEAMARGIHDANPGVHEPWANIVAAETLGNRLAQRTAALRRAEARAAIRALSAAGWVVEQGWQPIETAPRGGTRFIAWWQPCPQLPAGGWHECQWHNGNWHHPFFQEPTHWQPPPVDGPHIAAAFPAAPQEDKR